MIKTIASRLRSAWTGLSTSTAHRLTALLILGVVLAASNMVFFRSVLNDVQDMAGTISTAGKLRLLSQKIELDILELETNPAGSSAAVLNGVTEFNAVIDALADGGVVLGAVVRPVPARNQMALAGVRARWIEYRDQIIIALQNAGHAPVDRVTDFTELRHQMALRATRLLHASERLVDAIVKDLQQQQQMAVFWMYLSATGIVLYFSALLWFVWRRINRPLQLLGEGMHRLSAGDYQLHMQYPRRDDMGRLIEALNNSAQHFGAMLHELEDSHASLSRAENMFRGMAEHSGIGVYVHSGTRFLFVNPAMAQMLGYEREEMMKHLKPRDVLSEPVDVANTDVAPAAHDGGPTGPALLRHGRCRDGSIIELEVFESPIPFDGDTVTMSVALDVTARREAEEQIWRQAHFDCLTNLPNRHMIQDKLGVALALAKARGESVALVLLDIDHFKYVNETLGLSLGDELLKQAASRIKRCLRDDDKVGRLGGDEFMIIIGDIEGPITADRVCQRIMAAMSTPFRLEDEDINLTVSMGLTVFPQDGDTIFDLFKNADMALYEAKLRGRNQYCWYRASMKEKVALRRRLGRELSHAIKHDEFSLLYQPIVDLKTGKICKAEALIRWQHPERGLIGPAEFIPFAEDSGVIEAIGDWVFRTAAQQAARWQNQFDANFQVSINMSPVQFQADGTTLQAWFERMKGWNVQGRNLVVEITEGLLMDPGGTVSAWLNAFQECGIEVALDDFGTGYSSLAYLKKFDINYVKIDRSFVAGLGPCTEERVLCEAIIVMAHRLGLKVIAEGIETDEQRRTLADAGCDYGQGFLFGRPVSSAQFERMVQSATM